METLKFNSMSLITLFTPGDSQLFTNINISDLMRSEFDA